MDPVVLAGLFVASTINAALPGPCMILTVGRAARDGLRAGALVSAGVLLGDVAMLGVTLLVLLGLLGIGRAVFEAMRLAGAVILLAIAARMLRPPGDAGVRKRGTVPLGDLAAGVLVGASSPFNLVFMLALMPQFVPSTGVGAATVILLAVGFLGGVVVAQAGATLLGGTSLRFGGNRRWVEVAAAGALAGFGGLALIAPIG